MAVVRKLEPVAQNDEATGPTEAQVLAVINAAVSILGARLLLVIGAIGALFLAYLALQSTNTLALWAQSIFSLTVFDPLVWLSAKRAV